MARHVLCSALHKLYVVLVKRSVDISLTKIGNVCEQLTCEPIHVHPSRIGHYRGSGTALADHP